MSPCYGFEVSEVSPVTLKRNAKDELDSAASIPDTRSIVVAADSEGVHGKRQHNRTQSNSIKLKLGQQRTSQKGSDEPEAAD